MLNSQNYANLPKNDYFVLETFCSIQHVFYYSSLCVVSCTVIVHFLCQIFRSLPTMPLKQSISLQSEFIWFLVTSLFKYIILVKNKSIGGVFLNFCWYVKLPCQFSKQRHWLKNIFLFHLSFYKQLLVPWWVITASWMIHRRYPQWSGWWTWLRKTILAFFLRAAPTLLPYPVLVFLITVKMGMHVNLFCRLMCITKLFHFKSKVFLSKTFSCFMPSEQNQFAICCTFLGEAALQQKHCNKAVIYNNLGECSMYSHLYCKQNLNLKGQQMLFTLHQNSLLSCFKTSSYQHVFLFSLMQLSVYSKVFPV